MDSNSNECVILQGPVLPSIANLHSHSFQYLMAGLAEVKLNANDSFWSWRDLMYRLVGKLSPSDVRIITTQLYIDLLKAGYTQVGEFHYLHKDNNGGSYDNIGEIADQLILAADQSGIGVSLLPALYSHTNFGSKPPSKLQQRFINSTDEYLKLLEVCSSKLNDHPLHNTGVCFHSLRAVNQQQMTDVLAAYKQPRTVHLHIAEQQKEVDDCIEHSGQRPVEWLSNHFNLDSSWCLIHATHIDQSEIKRIASSGAVVGLCPSTEANLGDGIFPAPDYVNQGGSWGIGTDSHVGLSIANELRSLEYSQRLRDQQRNRIIGQHSTHVGDFMFRCAHQGGNQALSINCGLAVGQRADFVVLDSSNPFIGASKPEDIINRWLFASNDNVIKDVYVAGEPVIQDFRHILEAETRSQFTELIKRIL